MAKELDQIIEAVLALPEVLILGGDIAGNVAEVVLGGSSFDLEVPSIELGSGDKDPVVLPPEVKSVTPGINWAEKLGNPWGWGQVNAWRKDGGSRSVSAIYVSHLLLKKEFRSPANSSKKALDGLGDKIFDHAVEWVDLLFDWLEVGSESLLREGVTLIDDPSTGLLVMGHDGTDYKMLSSKSIKITSVMRNGISLELWQKCLAATSSGKTPPTEYILLRDARRHFNNGDFRRSVLDAATAAEIGLQELLEMQLSDDSSGAGELIRKKWRQIHGLSEALKTFGVPLPNDIASSGLATPRNKAIHHGDTPTKEEAERSIAIAKEILDMEFPISSFL